MSWTSRLPWSGSSSGGRWSPFGSRSSTSAPSGESVVVTDNDFSYINPDDLDSIAAHNSTTTSQHANQHAAKPTNPLQQQRGTDLLHIRHKSTRYPIHFPQDSISAGQLTIGQLRDQAARKLDLHNREAASRVRMFYKGRNLKDDKARCRDEGLSSDMDGDILCVIGDSASSGGAGTSSSTQAEVDDNDDGEGDDDGDNDGDDGDELDESGQPSGAQRRKRNRNRKKKGKKGGKAGSASTSGTATPLPMPETFNYGNTSTFTPPPPAPKPTAPQTALEKCANISASFRATLLPQCEAFIARPPSDAAKRTFEHKKLSETVLAQVLLKLDAIETEGNEEARRSRKELVREVQGVLNKLDEIVGGEGR